MAAGVCGRCHHPVAAALEFTKKPTSNQQSFSIAANQLPKADSQLSTLGFQLSRAWPKPSIEKAPSSLPLQVERAFLQGERNRLMPDNGEAAVMMYRRALEIGLKEAFPEEGGNLAGKLNKLVQQKKLPDAIGEWAHEVRAIGNDGAHEIDGVTQADVHDARAFVDTVLQYLFTLPAQIAARRPVQMEGAEGNAVGTV